MAILTGLQVLFGGVRALTSSRVVKRMVTHLTAECAWPIITQYLLTLSDVGREAIGNQLEKAGKALRDGRVSDCAASLAEIIDGVRF